MKQIKILTVLLLTLVICAGCPRKCEDCHQYITFINKSDENIICEFQRENIEKRKKVNPFYLAERADWLKNPVITTSW